MPIKIYKPTTPARRKTSVLKRSELTRKKPQKKLTKGKKKRAGRNNQGRITIRHQGGGSRKKIRQIDFKMDKFDVPAKVVSIEYDPNRSANIALVSYLDGERKYIIAPIGLKVDQRIISSEKKVKIATGNRMRLKDIPTGNTVHNIELEPGHGGKIVRSAGACATLMVVEGKHAQLKLPSGEVRLVLKDCSASLGQVSNPDFRNIRWGKAGRMRHKGIRPTVRGKAMNPVDHPHGGGEGSNPIGLKHPKTPWGKPALGVRTRKNKKYDKLILRRRKSKRRR
jgi:large subunit ribosomal protein L2